MVPKLTSILKRYKGYKIDGDQEEYLTLNVSDQLKNKHNVL